MTLYFPENTYYELPFKEVVYYAFHGHSCVSRQPRSGRGGGGEEKKKEWEEVFSLLFSLSRIKIPVIRYISPFSRVFLGSKTFFPALFLLRGYRFGSFVCIHMYDEKETVIKLRL